MLKCILEVTCQLTCMYIRCFYVKQGTSKVSSLYSPQTMQTQQPRNHSNVHWSFPSQRVGSGGRGYNVCTIKQTWRCGLWPHQSICPMPKSFRISDSNIHPTYVICWGEYFLNYTVVTCPFACLGGIVHSFACCIYAIHTCILAYGTGHIRW